jgi:hypothetical protein
MTNYAQKILAVIATVIAIIVPLFNYLPKLYHWFVREYTDKLLCRLRIIETGLQTEPGVEQLQAFQNDIESISRAAYLLPMRHTDLFFSLIRQIDRERTQLASRLAAAQSGTAKTA